MSIKVPRLKVNRFGVYCIRVYLRNEDGKLRETQYSLNTKIPQIARVLALQFNKAFEQLRAMKKPTIQDFQHLLNSESSPNKYELDLERGIMKTDGTAEDHQRMMEAIQARKELENYVYSSPIERKRIDKLVQKSHKLSEVIEHYFLEKKTDNKEDTILAKKRTYQSFIDLFGDLEINLYTKQEIVAYKSNQLSLGLSAHTINSKIGELNGLFEYALTNGFYTASNEVITKGIKISSGRGKKVEHKSYEPFSNDELIEIFSEDYTTKFNKPDFYFIPLIALFTGARREEIAGLKTENIRTIDDILSIEIEEGKNGSARRIVPIHSKLIELGLLDYKKYIEDSGYYFLFPHLKEGKNGKGKNVGRHFSNYLRDDLEIMSERKVFHSFRHTVITRLHTLNSNPVHALQIVGHNDESSDSVHIKVYTHDVGLQALQETLNKLSYKIDFEKIKIKDVTFNDFLSKWLLKENKGKPLFKGRYKTNF